MEVVMFKQIFVSATDTEGEFVRIGPDTLFSNPLANTAWSRVAAKAEELSREGHEIMHFERVYDFTCYMLYGYYIYCREMETPA
jgi:hypothetical protein